MEGPGIFIMIFQKEIPLWITLFVERVNEFGKGRKNMRIVNGFLFLEDKTFLKGEIRIQGDRIVEMGEKVSFDEETQNASECYVIPGFFDIHIHGCAGSDFCDGTEKSLRQISNYLASQGVTSFLATGMSLPEQVLQHSFSTAVSFQKNSVKEGAVLRGIRMEGPFLSPEKRGAHDLQYLKNPDIDLFFRLFEAAKQQIKLFDIAQ